MGQEYTTIVVEGFRRVFSIVRALMTKAARGESPMARD